jgi:cell division septation protein DedD
MMERTLMAVAAAAAIAAAAAVGVFSAFFALYALVEPHLGAPGAAAVVAASAAILVALLVIVVPEMLSGPDAPGSNAEAPPAAPATDGPPLRKYTADLTRDAVIQPESPPAVTGLDSPVLPQEPPPEMPAEPAPAATPEPARAAVPDPAATVQPVPADRGWTVQVGVFAQAENADGLARKLESLGHSASVSRATAAKGKVLFRVRVGPVPDRAAALRLQSRLSMQGHKGTLVAP